jgi:hypothetical protein
MSKRITITAGQTQVRAKLNDTLTARAIAEALPITGRANRWGGEIYFPVDVDVDLEKDARRVVEMGELAYWPPGSAFCIFFGPTPASTADEIRTASPVNIIGQIEGHPHTLSKVLDGMEITIEADLEFGD